MRKKFIFVLCILSFIISICNSQDSELRLKCFLETDSSYSTVTSESPDQAEACSLQKPEACFFPRIIGFVKNTTGLGNLIIVFLILLIIPFIPAIREIVKPKDLLPLSIDQDYVRDPRFFETQLLEELHPVIDAQTLGTASHMYKNKVPIDVFQEIKASDKVEPDHVIIVQNNMNTANKKSFNQPVYVKGKTNVGENCSFEILMVEGDITIGSDFRLNRWMSSNSRIVVKENAMLGKKVNCSGVLQMNKGCRFINLYAMPIATYDVDFNLEIDTSTAVVMPLDFTEQMTDVGDLNWYISKEVMTIPPYSMVNNDMVVKSDLVLRQGVVVNGNIKVYGKVTLEKEVRVFVELICNSDIEIGEYCYIRENLFTQSRIIVKSGARFGLPGQHKSIIGKKGISLDKNVLIYGNIVTAGEGIVV